MSVTARKHRLGLYLKSKDRRLSRKSQSSLTPSTSRKEERRQKLEFREAHQQSPTEMEELRKFQSSTLDTMAR